MYNEAVSLYRLGFSLHEYEMRDIVRAVMPKRFRDVPCRVLNGAITDAYRAHKAVCKKRKQLKDKGIKRKVKLHFRSHSQNRTSRNCEYLDQVPQHALGSRLRTVDLNKGR